MATHSWEVLFSRYVLIQYVQQNPNNSGLTGWKPGCVSHDSEEGSSRAARVALHQEDVQASRSP